MSLHLQPLGPAIGARVGGLRLADGIDDATRDALLAALLQHHVLFFEDQPILPAAQRDLTARFGTMIPHPICPHAPGIPEIEKLRWEKAHQDHPPRLHPVMRTHPAIGRQGLFVNEGFTTRIVELNPAESEAVLRQLAAHIARPEFTVRWRWKLGESPSGTSA